MKRRNAAVAAAAIVVLAMAGFAGSRLLLHRSAPGPTLVAAKATTCKDTYRVVKLVPSQVAVADPNCLSQSLTFSGELHGTVAEAFTVSLDAGIPGPMCSMPSRWDNFPKAALAMTIGGKAYLLLITPPGSSERQAISFAAAGRVQLVAIADTSVQWNQASGTVALNPDGITGTIDAKVARDVTGAQPVHIVGQWSCGAPAPLPQLDTSTPCGAFFALNQLGTVDTTRMKSECNPEDLTFSGALAAHVTASVTDIAGPTRWNFGADNVCKAAYGYYFGTMKFSVGYETFLLELGTDSYPSDNVGPGTYSAVPGSSVGAVLFLGSADPSQQGLFAIDGNTKFWQGQSGTFTIAGDMKSGTIDADLKAPTQASAMHVSGSWRCAA